MVISREIHLFASHKGGTGKTMLCFQIACQYAHENPEEHVLAFDLTELGDLTKRLFGHRADVIEDQCGAIFDLFHAVDKQKSMLSVFKSSVGMNQKIDFTNSVQPSVYNEAIPPNVYLVSSGAATQDMESFDYNKYAESIRSSLETSDKRWKVFIDTDGDRRPAPFTKLGYCLAHHIVVPLEPDFADFERLVQMVHTVDALSNELNFHSKISQVIWNKMQLQRVEGNEYGSFVTTKVAEELIDALNQRLYGIAKESSLFLHKDDPTLKEFVMSTVCRVRDFSSTVCLPSNAQGLPFCRMQPGTITTGKVKFQIKAEQIDGAAENIKDILGRLESMVQ
eukprot:GEMP01051858.1.p1 GENE.GEMP01051858.1~~GEMP01051858.1.p1  ORF type:complete len:337 (+),score=75.03 GEMP01051858.1:73-1083(+)